MLDLSGVLNRPQPDAAMIEAAGVDLDRALFPLLARIERLGPIGIVELADLVGRDYSTVSRQVTKLAELGLIARCPSPEDKRVRAAILTDQGRVMTVALDAARQKLIGGLLADWKQDDVATLAVLLRKFADGALAEQDSLDFARLSQAARSFEQRINIRRLRFRDLEIQRVLDMRQMIRHASGSSMCILRFDRIDQLDMFGVRARGRIGLVVQRNDQARQRCKLPHHPQQDLIANHLRDENMKLPR